MLAGVETHRVPPGADELLALSSLLPMFGRSRRGLHHYQGIAVGTEAVRIARCACGHHLGRAVESQIRWAASASRSDGRIARWSPAGREPCWRFLSKCCPQGGFDPSKSYFDRSPVWKRAYLWLRRYFFRLPIGFSCRMLESGRVQVLWALRSRLEESIEAQPQSERLSPGEQRP